MIDDAVFQKHESVVRSYCRDFPAVFEFAAGDHVLAEDGRRYIDFLAGAGSLNYGHNNPHVMQAVVEYLKESEIVHSLDLYTVAKRRFIKEFNDVILSRRGLNYRMQFPGPTGTNAVEAALKLARKITKRSTVAAFTNGFHGMTLGALAATGNQYKRRGAGVALHNVVRMPFENYHGPRIDTVAMIEKTISDPGSGIEPPAAFLVETVQGEGGLNVASESWLRRLKDLASRVGALLVIDDIQAGCGRTGSFFSFERAGIAPDIVCLSKSIGGIGLPLALVLIKPEYDLWGPGEHNGTFRGNNLAFVAATAALDFWRNDQLSDSVVRKGHHVMKRLTDIVERHLPGQGAVRGRGLLVGVAFSQAEIANQVSHAAFRRGLIVETCGPRSEVLKLLPPLTVDPETLEEGLDIIEASVMEVMALQKAAAVGSLDLVAS